MMNPDRLPRARERTMEYPVLPPQKRLLAEHANKRRESPGRKGMFLEGPLSGASLQRNGGRDISDCRAARCPIGSARKLGKPNEYR
jgi:hypothetical protein